MQKLLVIILCVFVAGITFGLFFLDKPPFLCPVSYEGGLIIRTDARGDGFFAAKRNGRRLHNGIDLYAALGTPVYASRSGIVTSVTENKGMGKYVVLRHPGNTTTIYGHLSAIYVRKNQLIRQGQVIGAVGKTGNANFPDIQPHLHLEVRQGGVAQDPLEYLE